MSYSIMMTEKHIEILKSSVLLYNNMQKGNISYLKEFFENENSKTYLIPDDLLIELSALFNSVSSNYLVLFDWIHYIIFNNITPISNTEPNTEYQLIISLVEMGLISNCLDLYTRILMGQFDELSYLFINTDVRYAFELPLLQLRQIFFPKLNCSLNGSYGITSDEISKNAQIAYEIYKIIRKELWIANDCKPSYSVYGRGPLALSDEPFIKIKKL